MIMMPSIEADKLGNQKDRMNAKEFGYFKAYAGYRFAQPSLRANRTCVVLAVVDRQSGKE
jgi:hypothetical protein